MLWKKFLLATGLLLVFMGLSVIPILFLVPWVEASDDSTPILLIFFGYLIVFLPVMEIITRIAFYFPGSALNQKSESDLRSELLAINPMKSPVVVREKGKKLVVTYDYANLAWRDILATIDVQQSFSIVIRFNEAKHECLLTDVWRGMTKEKTVGGGFSFQSSFFAHRGVMMVADVGKIYGLQEQFGGKHTAGYSFSDKELHRAVLNTILRAGWSVRYTLL